MTCKFKPGDKVRLIKFSEYYTRGMKVGKVYTVKSIAISLAGPSGYNLNTVEGCNLRASTHRFKLAKMSNEERMTLRMEELHGT